MPLARVLRWAVVASLAILAAVSAANGDEAASIARIRAYSVAMRANDPATALKEIRAEMAAPMSEEAAYRARIYIQAIQALGALYKTTPNPDLLQEAKRLRREVISMSGSAPGLASIDTVWRAAFPDEAEKSALTPAEDQAIAALITESNALEDAAAAEVKIRQALAQAAKSTTSLQDSLKFVLLMKISEQRPTGAMPPERVAEMQALYAQVSAAEMSNSNKAMADNAYRLFLINANSVDLTLPFGLGLIRKTFAGVPQDVSFERATLALITASSIGEALRAQGELRAATELRNEFFRVSKPFFDRRQLSRGDGSIYSTLHYEQLKDFEALEDHEAAIQFWPTAEAVFRTQGVASNLHESSTILEAMGETAAAKQARALSDHEYGKMRAGAARSNDPDIREYTATIGACEDMKSETKRGNWKAALALLDTCGRNQRALKAYVAKKPGTVPSYVSLDQIPSTPEETEALQAVIGYVYEGVGDDTKALAAFDLAVSRMEQSRATFTVEGRSQFFANPAAREAYWGAIRVYARRAAAAKNSPDSFFALLGAMERMRARQFGEIVGAPGAIQQENLAAIAKTIPEDTLVLAYTVSDQGLIGAAFNSKERHSAAVGVKRAELSRLAQSALATLSDPQTQPGADQSLQRIAAAMLGPFANILAGKKAIIVVPDDVLGSLPPAILPGAPDADFFIAPAVRMIGSKSTRSAKVSSLLAFADPAYPASIDLKLSPVAVRGFVGRGRLRASNSAILIPPLPETRDEARAIATILKAPPSSLLVGPQATESALKRADFSKVRFLHIATHGVLAGEVPGLGEPALILAKEPKEDSFFRASEVRALHLDTELTVLSACNTGSGQVVAGEGVMGLGRAFLLAGSQSVLVSLWPVDSDTTVELMTAFYDHMQAGDLPSAALHKTMTEIREKHSHPFFWAPFVLISR